MIFSVDVLLTSVHFLFIWLWWNEAKRRYLRNSSVWACFFVFDSLLDLLNTQSAHSFWSYFNGNNLWHADRIVTCVTCVRKKLHVKSHICIYTSNDVRNYSSLPASLLAKTEMREKNTPCFSIWFAWSPSRNVNQGNLIRLWFRIWFQRDVMFVVPVSSEVSAAGTDLETEMTVNEMCLAVRDQIHSHTNLFTVWKVCSN